MNLRFHQIWEISCLTEDPLTSPRTLLTALAVTIGYIYIYIYIYIYMCVCVCVFVCVWVCVCFCLRDCINSKTFLSQVYQWGENESLVTVPLNVHTLLAPDERWVSKFGGILSGSRNLISAGQACSITTLYAKNPTSLHWDWVPEYPVNSWGIKYLSFSGFWSGERIIFKVGNVGCVSVCGCYGII